MTQRPADGSIRPKKSYHNLAFLNSADARPIRVLCEFVEPSARDSVERGGELQQEMAPGQSQLVVLVECEGTVGGAQ